MGLTCNIDAKGKKVRFINGIVTVLIALVLAAFWAIPAGTAIPWMVTAFVFLSGAFMIFDARASWCVIRAMGSKTKI